MKLYIGIKLGTKNFYPLLVGYTADGGFWLKDLFIKQGTAYITKMRIPRNSPTDKTMTIPVNKKAEWITYLNPKLTHHADGTAHISGTGIISGFYKLRRKAKGVHVESMNLFRNDNDGGPIFIFSCWGLDDFGSTSANDNQNIIFEQQEIRTYPLGPEGRSDYVIEGFYVSKALERMIDPVTRIFLKSHPLFGELPLKILPAPDNAPGYIGLACFHGFTQSQHDSGFSLTGGPGRTDNTGHFENIAIIKPATEKYIKKGSVKVLDLNLLKIRSVIFKIDRYFASRVETLNVRLKKFIEKVRSDVLKISPTKIIHFRLSLLMNKRYITKGNIVTISRLITRLIGVEEIQRYQALYFYTGTISNSISKEAVANLFRELSQNVTTPIFAHPRRQVEEATYRICSLARFRLELSEFLLNQKLPPLNANELEIFENALRKVIRKKPLILTSIPEALPGSNIRWFMVAPYAYIMGPFPSALYSTTQLFSSHAPLAFTVEGSVLERTAAEVPAYRHLASRK